MRELLTIRDFRLLWAAQAVSNFGDALTNLALLLTTQRLTGSVAAVATTAIAVAVPNLLFGMVAGAYVDRWNRKKVMIVSDLLRASFVLVFLLVTSADRMWLLYTVAFIQASVGTFFNPAKSAYLPRIVGTERLLAANSVSQMTQIGFGLLGTTVAGVIAAVADSLASAFVVDAATFLVSLAALSLIATSADADRTTASTGLWSEVKAGIAAALRSRTLLGVMIGAGIFLFGLGAVNVLLVPFIVEDLAVPESWFGAIEGAQVASMIAAGAVVTSLARRFRPTSLITWGLAVTGVIVAAIARVTEPWHLMVALFAIGWVITPLQASVSTLVQTEVDDELRGRTGAALNTIVTASQVTSMALAGVAAALVGVRGVFVLAGATGVVAALATAGLFRGVTLRTPVSDRA